MVSPWLQRKVWHYAARLRNIKQYPAAVVGAEHSHLTEIARSSKAPVLPLVARLRERLEILGRIDSRVNGNYLGRCAEVRASNKILVNRPSVKVKDIDFTEAIRPRTMQFVKTCDNCRQTFR